jgi:lysine 2,3-aminomutase
MQQNKNDWKWQLKNMICDVDELKKYIHISSEQEEEIRKVEKKYRWGISPYYLALMDKENQNCPIRKQGIPSINEFDDVFQIDNLPSYYQSAVGSENPLWKNGKTEVDCIFWSYPDRVLFYLTNLCAMYCRHCYRKKKKEQSSLVIDKEMIDRGVDYIAKHKEIRDVLLSGGDPLMLDDDVIEYVLSALRKIPHVEIIRIGSRMPCTLPQRVTDDLCKMIQKYHPIWINTHFNHPKELTEEAKAACAKLVNAGIPLGNQSVLLKGVNDNVETMKKLVCELVRARVRPYYLHHADLVEGSYHFRTSIDKGMNIIENLRGHISGFAVPMYVICTPLGKVPLQPNYLVGKGEGYVVLRNYEFIKKLFR